MGAIRAEDRGPDHVIRPSPDFVVQADPPVATIFPHAGDSPAIETEHGVCHKVAKGILPALSVNRYCPSSELWSNKSSYLRAAGGILMLPELDEPFIPDYFAISRKKPFAGYSYGGGD